MACKHVDAPGKLFAPQCPLITNPCIELRAPTASQSVYREDCTQCFDSIVSPLGAIASSSADIPALG